MKQYLELVQHVLDHGEKKDDRTGTGTISVFGYQAKYDLREGFLFLQQRSSIFCCCQRTVMVLKGSTNK